MDFELPDLNIDIASINKQFANSIQPQKVEMDGIYPIGEMVKKQVVLLQEQNKQLNETCQSLRTIIETQQEEIQSNRKELKRSWTINCIMLGVAVLSMVATIIVGVIF